MLILYIMSNKEIYLGLNNDNQNNDHLNKFEKERDNRLEGNLMEYDKLVNIHNNENNILEKNNKYLEFKNNKFYDNIKEIRRIESVINTKDKLIKENRDYYDKFKFKMNMIVLFFLYILFVIIGFIVYNRGKISYITFILFVITCSLILLIWIVLGKNTMKGLKKVGNDLDKHVGKNIQKSVDYVMDNTQDIVNDVFATRESIDPRCRCPPEEENVPVEESQDEDYNIDLNSSINNGLYYKDISAPRQRLLPPGSGGKDDYKVLWQTNKQLGNNKNANYSYPGTLRWSQNQDGTSKIDSNGDKGGFPYARSACDAKITNNESTEYTNNLYTKTNQL